MAKKNGLQDMQDDVFLSIVIPACNEAAKIADDITAISHFLTRHAVRGQIIIVDDGSSDGTSEIARQCSTGENVSLEIIEIAENTGKGFAVKTGVLKAQGRYIMFADCGSCINMEYALKATTLIESGQCDIAHASRKLNNSRIQVHQWLHRRVLSLLFRQITRLYLPIPPELTDTQCGFKIYTADAAKNLYTKCVTKGFMFDIEIILRAVKQGYRIKEFEIDWTCDRDSRLSVRKNFFATLRELRKIKKNLKTDKPGSNKNQ